MVVFQTFRDDGSDAVYGDEGKWRWMARIPGLNDTQYGNYSLGVDWTDNNEDGQIGSDELLVNQMGNSTVLYKLMYYARDMVLNSVSNIQLEHFEEAYFSQEIGATPEFRDSQGYFIPMVCVYKVIYD